VGVAGWRLSLSLPLPRKKEKKGEGNAAILIFFSCTAYALHRKQPGAHAAEADSWADALHLSTESRYEERSYRKSRTGETQKTDKKKTQEAKGKEKNRKE